MAEFTAPSGAKVVINPAPWKDAKALKKAIMKEMAGAKLDFKKETMIAAILKADASDIVDAALWPCLVRCTRDNEKIVESTFDSTEARKDYYEIVLACVKENLNPLADSLFSMFADLATPPKQAEENPAP